jgi:putative hydrolase of the HAD superfamily
MFDVIAFDADDTLWYNEDLYTEVKDHFKSLLLTYASDAEIEAALYSFETGNLPYFGYGIKGYAISLIETAIAVSKGEIRAADLQSIIDDARRMLAAPVRLFPHVAETVAQLAKAHRLMIITKGDPRDQQDKVDRSGIAEFFSVVEVLSDKNPASYAAILAKHHLDPANFIMVGNSLKSDILPVVALGGRAVYIPYALTWAHENEVAPDSCQDCYTLLEHIGLLPGYLATSGTVKE